MSNSSRQEEVTKPIKIEFIGLTAFTACDALKLLLNSTKLTDRVTDDQTTLEAASIVKTRLESKGYLNARVDVAANDDTSSVQFIISEGFRFPIAEVRFEGNKSLSTLDLSNAMQDCLGQYDSKGYDGDVFDVCERRTTDFIRRRGYLQARIESDKQRTNQGLKIVLKVDEGRLYRLGEIKIVGSEWLSAADLRARLKLHQGDIVEGEKLAEWLFEDLKKLYGDMGFIQYTSEPVPTFKNGVVDFEVFIDEGNRFTVRSITFTTDGALHSNPLSTFGFGEGDYYNQTLFEESLKRLNDTGLFEVVDLDRDVKLKTDEEDSSVGVEITLHNKKP